MAFNQRINFPVLVTIGVAGVLLLAVFITGTQAWFAYEQTSVTEMRIANAGQSDYVNHRDQQLAALQQPPHWGDHSKTKIAIPIEQAMRILVENHGALPSTQPAAFSPSSGIPGEGWGEGRFQSQIANRKFEIPNPAGPHPLPEYRARGQEVTMAGFVLADTPQSSSDPAGRVPHEIRNVGIAEHLGATLPLNAPFTNERGENVSLGNYFNHGRPLVLQLGYFQCPMLCSLVSQGLVDSAKEINLIAGRDFDMLFVSIDSTETPSLAALKKTNTVDYYGKKDEADGFHFLVGREWQIRRVTDAVGFNYQFLQDTHQYAHAAVIIILTPDGHISRYLYGIKFAPQTLRLSLVEAAAGKIGTAMDQVLLVCLHYDSATGKYGWVAVGLMRIGGVLTLAVLGGAIGLMLRREFKHRGVASAQISNLTLAEEPPPQPSPGVPGEEKKAKEPQT